MKKCYVAGKIGDLPEEVYTKKFFHAALEVQYQLGMEPILPIDVIHDHDKSWLNHMRADLIALLQHCDAVYACIDWRDSKGARIEVQLAIWLGIEVIYQKRKPNPDNEIATGLALMASHNLNECDFCDKGSVGAMDCTWCAGTGFIIPEQTKTDNGYQWVYVGDSLKEIEDMLISYEKSGLVETLRPQDFHIPEPGLEKVCCDIVISDNWEASQYDIKRSFTHTPTGVTLNFKEFSNCNHEPDTEFINGDVYCKHCLKMMYNVFKEDWVLVIKETPIPVDREWSRYPVGTKAPSTTGGYWFKSKYGWEWNGPHSYAASFPTPGANNNQTVILPNPHDRRS